MVAMLLNNKARTDLTDQKGETPLHTAVKMEHVDIVSLLLNHGVQVDSIGKCGYTSLMSASSLGLIDIVNLFLTRGAKFEKESRNTGRTPLILASAQQKLNVINKLIDYGSDVNRITSKSESALMIAVANNRLESMNALIDRGARVDLEGEGVNPITVASYQVSLI